MRSAQPAQDADGHKASRQVLVTRPEAEAEATAARLRALGWQPLLAPVLVIARQSLRLPPEWRPQAVLVTSGNALPALPASLHGLPMLAVGDATAARARADGFAQVFSAGGDAAALERLVLRRCLPAAGPLLLAAGAGQGEALMARLREQGFRVLRRSCYIARPVRRLPEAARAALAEHAVSAALFFSAASAEAFAATLRRAQLVDDLYDVCAAAISPATAAALAPLPWRDIRVASRPNQEELLACLS